MNLLFAVLPFTLFASDKICTKHLDRLLALHQEYGLPLPPPEAKLVRFRAFQGQVGYDAERATRFVNPNRPNLGFSLDGRTVLGNFNEPGQVDEISPAKPEAASLGEDARPDLLPAIQFHGRGWKTLSHAAYRLWLAENVVWDWGEDALAEMAWEQWMFRLSFDPHTPLPMVAKHLKRVRAQLDPEAVGGEFVRELLRDLDLALTPRNSRPGSDEALIDDLIYTWGSEAQEHIIKEPRTNTRYQTAFRASTRYQAILDRGFAIVPALIAHLDDQRLTRFVEHIPIINRLYDTYHCRVKDIVWDILCTLAGERLDPPKLKDRNRAADARKWFAAAQKIGEENYFIGRVLGPKDNPFVNDDLFWLVVRKYPKRLPEVYRKLIELPEPYLAERSWQLAQAIAASPLPDADKRKILEFAARQTNPHHRAAGVNFLRQFDAEKARELLIAGLDVVTGRVHDGVLTLAELVGERADPREWQALARAVRRADVGSRLELLKVIAEEPSHENRAVRLKFLAEYLTDDAVRDKRADPKRFDYFAAGRDFERLEVRDYVATRLVELLKLDLEPRPNWKPAQWARFREEVRVAVGKQLGR
jgi:hypothetical protein